MKTRCPHCGVIVEIPDEHDYIGDTTVYCEDCGEHPAEVCPNCNEAIDLIFAREE